MDNFEWTTLKSKHLVKDRWISLRGDTCKMPNGKIIEPYYVLEYPTWVNIVALTKEKEVILVRQYRHGLQKTIMELPGGCMESTDNSPLETIKRELLEETGYTSNNIIETCRISVNPANHNNLTYCYLALDSHLLTSQKLDDTEQVEVILRPLDEVMGMLNNQEFLQALHISSLYYAIKHLDNAKAEE
jgi:ADP-ribose pyrophosphatase